MQHNKFWLEFNNLLFSYYSSIGTSHYSLDDELFNKRSSRLSKKSGYINSYTFRQKETNENETIQRFLERLKNV